MRTPDNLEEYRIRASRLLRDLRGPDRAAALRAEERFRLLPSGISRDRIQRKHALAAVAKEAGFESWTGLKAAMSRAAMTVGPQSGFDTTLLFQPRSAASLNLWFRRYEEARQVLTSEPKRYLFPYRHQFVVCESALLQDLDVDVSDPDWERIGRDWVRPLDARAHARLSARLRRATTRG